MRRILIAVGTDSYDHLPTLQGAEGDATAIYEQLVSAGDYSRNDSVLLLSPPVGDIMTALSRLPFDRADVDTITIVFAGHGGAKSGTYYLCARDTHPDRLSTTGLAVGRLLSVIAELRPLQANIIIDACQSGGAMMESTALLNADALGLGSPGSLSIAFLAACGRSEYASETPSGGALTQRVLSYLKGASTLQTTRPLLDLIDLGRRVSEDLTHEVSEQTPVSWGVNLTGEGRFAKNPHFSPATNELAQASAGLSSGTLPPEVLSAVQSHAFALWSLHRSVADEVDEVLLRRTLRALLADMGDNATAKVRALRGLATSLRASATHSADVFAETLVVFGCAEPLLDMIDDEVAAEVAYQLVTEGIQTLAAVRQWLLDSLMTDRFCLLTDTNGIADLYFLPLRLSRILGWLATGLEVADLTGARDAEAEREVRNIAELLLEHYASSMVPRTDAQAPFVLAFVEAASRRGWKDIAETVLGCYFAGFVETKGVVARPDLPAEDAFSFTLSLGAGPAQVEHRFRANPTQFLPVLLICGASLGMDEHWNDELYNLDHQHGYVFVPAHYSHFARDIIEHGTNFGFGIGQDIYRLNDLRPFVATVSLAVNAASRGLSPIGASLALVASCLQPDRLAMHVVDFGQPPLKELTEQAPTA